MTDAENGDGQLRHIDGFKLEQSSGLRDPGNRLAWADTLIADVRRRRDYLGASPVGQLSVASKRLDDVVKDLQFRSEPLAGCGGAEFRYQVSDGNRHHHDGAIRDNLCEAERRLVAMQSQIARVARDVRDTTSGLIGRTKHDLTPDSLVAIGCVFAIRAGMRLQVDLEVLGHGLTLGVDRVRGESLDELRQGIQRLLSSHAKRHELRTALHWLGATGKVSTSIGPLLAHAGMSLHRALKHLHRHGELRFRCGKGRKVRAVLTWNEGTLKSSFSQPNLGLKFDRDVLTIHGQSLPDTVQAALPGRRLDALLLHPCLPPDAIITSVQCHKGYESRTVVGLELGTTLLTASGIGM